jgi:hypothetical protein
MPANLQESFMDELANFVEEKAMINDEKNFNAPYEIAYVVVSKSSD